MPRGLARQTREGFFNECFRGIWEELRLLLSRASKIENEPSWITTPKFSGTAVH